MQRLAILLLVLLVATTSRGAFAQSHFTNCDEVTGSNATIILPAGAAITLYGTPIPENSELAVFTEDGTCAGAVVWTGDAASFPIWGDNSLTTVRDGLAETEELTYRLWDASTNAEYDGANLATEVSFSDDRSFFRTENSFVQDAVYVLNGLAMDAAHASNISDAYIGEAGSVTVSQSSRDEWHTVNLMNSYTSPVVTMGPLSYNGAHPSTVRVRNVTSASFEFKIDEWDYLDGAHIRETTGYLVVESGIHTLEDGRILQAGRAPAGPNASSVSFASPFLAAPVVVTQVETALLSTTVVARQADVTSTGFSLLLQSEEASTVSGSETVGWIAMSRGSGSTGGQLYDAQVTGEAVGGRWFGVAFQQNFSSTPAVVASIQTMNGVDASALRRRHASASGFEVTVEEEQSLDRETNHTSENVGYVAFEPGSIAAATPVLYAEQAIGESGMIAVGQSSAGEWHTLDFGQTYDNPVVVVSKLSYDGAQPSTIRVRNVTSSGCEFQLDEWDYLDGRHVQERFGYLVVEAGLHTLDDGRILQAGHATAGTNQRGVTFPHAFTSRPVVLSQITSVKDARAAVTRQSDVSVTGFSLFLQPQESVTSHDDETVAWIAASGGAGSTGGRSYEAGRTGNSVSDAWSSLAFGQAYSSSPVVLAAMQTANGLDVAGLRMQNHSASGIEVSVEEEKSSDNETRHVDETVGYLAFEAGLIETEPLSEGGLAKTASSEAMPQQALSFAAASGVPNEFALRGNYPNPFNPQTTIQYDLPADVHVQLEVFDVVGRRVALLADGVQAPGTHEVHFNAVDQPSGLYLYRLTAGSFVETGSMMLLK